MIGLGVMGQNLAVNMAHHGYTIAVYNRSVDKVDLFLEGLAKSETGIIGTRSIQEFIGSLRSPRKILLMVKAGAAVDGMIESLCPYLSKGDIIIDGGNSFFKDTIRRTRFLEEKGFGFLGVGISGGEEGALKGPSIMPGGSRYAWEHVGNMLTDIAAKVHAVPCCSFIGPDGAGHYVKMVHNGIEYADMQLISEAYFLMRELLNMSADEMHEVFNEWNQGDLKSYLIEITADILRKKDAETKKPIVNLIMDRAGQKGTGKWTSQEALELGISVPSIAEAVFARYISTSKEERVAASRELAAPAGSGRYDRTTLIKDLEAALYISKICVYAQGFALLKAASSENGWNLDLGGIALLWRGGCIIRAQFLNRIWEAFKNNPSLNNLLLDPYFKDVATMSQESWRRIVSAAAIEGVPIPAFSSALAYYDSYRCALLPANLIQAQRDYFGAHTYERTDKSGIFHTDWSSGGDIVTSESIE